MEFAWNEVAGPAGKLACWTRGERSDSETPAVFVHPINLQGSCWVEVARRLGTRFCLMPDLRGHGGSDAVGPFDIEAWSSDIQSAMAHFEIERAHFIGGSLGGPIAVYLAAHRPKAAVSIASFGGALKIEGNEAEDVLGTLRALGPKGMFRSVIPEISVGPETDRATLEWILAMTNPNDAETVYQIWEATLRADITKLAGSIECEVLVSNGEFDATCTPEQGRRMAAVFGTQLRVLPGVGHLPMCESPDLVAFLVDELMARTESFVESPV